MALFEWRSKSSSYLASSVDWEVTEILGVAKLLLKADANIDAANKVRAAQMAQQCEWVGVCLSTVRQLL